jgi:tetratricopeptide (TPR) repeat protein
MHRAAVKDVTSFLFSARDALGVGFLALLLLVLLSPRGFFAALREDAHLLFTGSAELAYEYGAVHFEAEHPHLYDVDRAEALFARAQKQNSDLEYVDHQLARIAFLRADFNNALGHINRQIQNHGENTPSSYYVRGLIRGFLGQYDAAAKDYEVYLRHNETNWAALNDYAWVLLKAGRHKDALSAAQKGLTYSPDNTWLLNSAAIALFELGKMEEAYTYAKRAAESVASVKEKDWLIAYPGNDPKIAGEGLAALKDSIITNMHRIEEKLQNGTIE